MTEAAGRVNSGTEYVIDDAAYSGGVSTGADVIDGSLRRERTNEKRTNVTQRNRARNRRISRGYAIFLIFISVATVLMCIYYLKLKSDLTTIQDSNETTMSQLSTLKAENDALYDEVTGSIDLDEIRERAINEFGMNYASQNQIIWYNADNSGYVRQYDDIPDVE